MSKTLGLDLGSNSIGWAVVDSNSKQILGSGVRIFQEGVVNLGDGDREISRNAARREARQVRRQLFRRRMRKRRLLVCLEKHGLCPQKVERGKWMQLDPYQLRDKALKAPCTLHEIGRIFYHLAQRRGFLSNSKSANANEDSAIYKSKDGKIGISETKAQIEDGTLGQYLYGIVPKSGERYKSGLPRARSRFTTRQMYVNEFERIWAAQAPHHAVLTDTLKTEIGGRKRDGYAKDGILFYQRPLKSQKHLIGKCRYEPNKTRCPATAIPAEYFRIYQFVNTIECNGAPLEQADRAAIIHLLERREKVAFKAIRKTIGKLDSFFQFNYQDDDRVVGCPVISKLCSKKAFGEAWFERESDKQESIWHVLYFFDDRSKLRSYAMDHWNVGEPQAAYISNIFLKRDYLALSRKAINYILPFLKDGFQYDVAVALAGVRRALGKRWLTLSGDDKQMIVDNVPDIVRSGLGGGYIQALKDFLEGTFGMSASQLKKLYHHSTEIEKQPLLDRLPVGRAADIEIQKLRNPVVVQALFELRKVVNALLDRYGPFDAIHIELGRDLKRNKTQRRNIRIRQKQLERQRDDDKRVLEEHGIPINHVNLLKYALWRECKKTSPFSGESIGCSELFSGQIQIEHIIPYSRSLDDSFLNKTLCETHINQDKGSRTPFEFFSDRGEWEEVKKRVLRLFHDTKDFPNRYQKFKRFVTEKLSDDFIARQLNDTRYMSRMAAQYLQKICETIRVFPGGATAHLRHYWGLNAIINHGDNQKNRDDHRHHAIDALVVALTKGNVLQELSRWNRYQKQYEMRDFEDPWDGFWHDARASILSILVSHKQQKKVLNERTIITEKADTKHVNRGVEARGTLHKESVFGKHKRRDGRDAFHIRKPIESLQKRSQIEKVVDSKIRALIYAHLESMGVDITDPKFSVPAGAFFETDTDGRTIPTLYLENQKGGEKIPIRKVRIREEIGNAVQLVSNVNQWVNPRNNHHVKIYFDANGKLKEHIVSFWEAVERKRTGDSPFTLPNDVHEMHAILMENRMFLIGLEPDRDIDQMDQNELSDYLYRVQKVSEGDYSFRRHFASTQKYKDQEVRIASFKKWKTLNPMAFPLDVLGNP